MQTDTKDIILSVVLAITLLLMSVVFWYALGIFLEWAFY